MLIGALALGSATPYLVDGLGGLDWCLVVYVTSSLTFAGGLIAEFAVGEGPFPFARGEFDPRQIRRVFTNRGVRLASLGYVGHMWELYAMWMCFLVFFSEALGCRGGSGGPAAAYATFAVIGVGGIGCWVDS
ncbi:MAG: hypothetical protein JOZ19_01850 [Rubrobacter sp.]|nr:hypothetical protein [Rubrobacter sp.]